MKKSVEELILNQDLNSSTSFLETATPSPHKPLHTEMHLKISKNKQYKKYS